MRALVVETSRTASERLRRDLAAGIPEIEVTEYDADERGFPDLTFDWSAYQVLLLADAPAGGGKATDWLTRLGGHPEFPPTLLIAGDLDIYGAAALTRAGAAGILLREDAQVERLARDVAAIARDPRVQTLVEPSAERAFAAINLEVPDPAAETSVGDEGYRFMRLIGQGGMSRVYLAKRVRDGMLIVIKTITTELMRSEEMRERFLTEAELASSIDSPHVVDVYDYGFGNNYGMIAMEFLPRGDLKLRMESGVSVPDARRFLRGTLLAIDAISAGGVVHRDLKPGNLMFRSDGSLVLADFGIAKRLDANELQTTMGRVLGTPAYLSPEQARGDRVDTRSDVYSAGVIFFEMLEGRRPFTGPTVEGMMYQHVHAPVPSLSPANAMFQPLIDRLLAKRPDDRFANAREAVDALDAG